MSRQLSEVGYLPFVEITVSSQNFSCETSGVDFFNPRETPHLLFSPPRLDDSFFSFLSNRLSFLRVEKVVTCNRAIVI